MANTISNQDDIIDSRDVIERIEELEGEQDALQDEIDGCEEDGDREEDLASAKSNLSEWEEQYGEELKTLRELAEEGESASSDWQHGATLIRDSYFEEYAQQLAKDIGAVDKSDWPMTCIDWTKAAEELLQSDYTSVDFDGKTYWVR